MNQIVIDLPIPVGFGKNARGHWSETNAEYQEHRMLARNEVNRQLRSGMAPNWRGAWLDVEWRTENRSWFPDEVNVPDRLAAYIDGAVETGLLIDDDLVKIGEIELRVDKERPGVTMRFTRRDDVEAD